jgi:hypothetical protein
MVKKLLLFLSFIIFQNIAAQVLHHQMLSAQGTSSTLANGMVVKQTVGQQSAIGNSQSTYYVGQGFQQSTWNSYIKTNIEKEIRTFVYPNPFIDLVNFEFSIAIGPSLMVEIFNVAGMVVFAKEVRVINNLLTLDLAYVPEGVYLVRLRASNFSYFTKVLKKI